MKKTTIVFLVSSFFYQNQLQSQWIVQTPPTTLKLEALHFFDANTGITSGSYTLLYKTIDGGTTWTSMGNYSSGRMSFVDANNGYGTAVTSAMIKKTSNAGTNWTSMTTPSESSFLDVFAVSPTTAYFINTEDKVFKTSNSGTSFFARPISLQDGSNQNLTSIFFTDDLTGYVTAEGNKNMFKTVNGGFWSLVNTGVSTSLNCVYFVNPSLGFAAGESGVIIKTTDGGSTWTEKSTGSQSTLNAIKFYNAVNGMVVGNDGTIFRTSDEGETWTADDSGTTNNLYNIFYVEPTSAVVVGDNGTVLKNTNLPLSSNNDFTLEKDFKLAPNPMNTYAVLSVSDLSSFTNPVVEMYTISGQLLKKESITSNQHIISKDNYQKGIYFLKIMENNQLVRTLKLIIN